MEVLRGIYLIKCKVSNVYLIDSPDGYVMVDTGTPNDAERIISFLSSLRVKLPSIRLIIVTHAHWDHVGGLKKLKEATGALVGAHRAEVPVIRGEVAAPRRRFDPVDVEVLLNDGDEVSGFVVIHTPGHTVGSACFLDQYRRVLFVGDVVYEEGGVLHEMYQHYSQDPDLNRKSIVKLLNYDFDHVLPSHGNPIIGRGKDALKQLAESLGLLSTS